MIAGRRARKRSLIRLNAGSACNSQNRSTFDGTTPLGQKQGSVRSEIPKLVLKSSPAETAYTTPLSPYAASASQPELSRYLRQLTALHAAGILTDDEFLAAKARLFGS